MRGSTATSADAASAGFWEAGTGVGAGVLVDMRLYWISGAGDNGDDDDVHHKDDGTVGAETEENDTSAWRNGSHEHDG